MALDKLKHVRIRGIACCVPQNIVDIDEFEKEKGAKAVESFKKTTGVYQKHCCEKNHIITAGDLCYHAAEKLILDLSIDKSSIDAVIFVTQSPDYMYPATACVLQYRLGLSEECLAYDINLGCSGYVYGLHVAATYLQSGHLKRILLLAGEANAHRQPVSAMLFGEAGSATLLEYDESQPNMNFLLRTRGSGFRELIIPYGGMRHPDYMFFSELVKENNPPRNLMDGAEVFNFSTREVPTLFKDYFAACDCTAEDFDVFVLHQANLIILRQIIKKLKLPKEKCPISLDCYGNTSSASIPLGICDYFNRVDKKVKESGLKHIAVCGYGVGLSLGVTSMHIDGKTCLPIITTNEAFEDGVEL